MSGKHTLVSLWLLCLLSHSLLYAVNSCYLTVHAFCFRSSVGKHSLQRCGGSRLCRLPGLCYERTTTDDGWKNECACALCNLSYKTSKELDSAFGPCFVDFHFRCSVSQWLEIRKWCFMFAFISAVPGDSPVLGRCRFLFPIVLLH